MMNKNEYKTSTKNREFKIDEKTLKGSFETITVLALTQDEYEWKSSIQLLMKLIEEMA